MRSKVLNSVVGIFLLPEGQVLLEQLNDGLGVSEGLLVDIVNFLEGFREGSLTELACLLVVVHHFIVEDREVEGEAEADWVAWIETLGKTVSIRVSFECALFHFFERFLWCRLSYVSVVIADHLLEESLGLVLSSQFEALALDRSNNKHALVVELFLDLLLVAAQGIAKLLVFWILLDGSYGADGASLRSNQVLEADGEQVPLVNGEVFTTLSVDGLIKELDHVLESLSLFGNSCQENFLLHLELT